MNGSNIPNSLLPHLNEIAERLWSSHAAIMVGAGFSRNATPIDDSCKKFPNWNDLGELFYEKARGTKIDGEKFLNPLKLADEVLASFDRPTLHKLLIDSIPDDEYEPSDLHVKLLNLPWVDVLTTNYDTLLERAAKFVEEYSYQTVVNIEELVYSKSSRIIKLHGSFPDTKPFIITEEDYRRYPVDFAPFVNTVQQALLENTLCLIGFSGDDPNFLRWIGWIRDNLGEDNSPNIYMIGVLNLTKAQELLLAKYKIVPIDMSELSDVGSHDYYKGIEKFFDFCASKKGESDRLDWPSDDKYSSPDLNDKNITEKYQAEKVASYWREQRLVYPGWVVVPEDRRKELLRGTRYWDTYLTKISEYSSILRLEFVFEYFWRIEKCLCPIFDNQVEAITSALDIFIPFFKEGAKLPKKIQEEMESNEICMSELKEKNVFLLLTLMRYYREEGKLEDWESCKELTDTLISREEDVARFVYERALFSLFEFDLDGLNSILARWDVKETMPFWLSKKAGLIAELGNLDEAIKMLEQSLSIIRVKQNLRPVTTNYSLVSQEAYVLVLLKYVKDGKAWQEHNFEKRPEFSERWNKLKQYKCDPWNELKLLEQPLKVEPRSNLEVSINNEFDIGRTTRTMHLGASNEDALNAFRILKFFEDIGIPYRIPGGSFAKESIEGAFKRVSEYVPYWVMATMLRMGSTKSVQHIFNRASLDSMSQSEVESLANSYISLFNRFVFKKGGTEFHQETTLKQIMPELLSRLICKSSFRVKKELFDLLKTIYLSEEKHDFLEVKELTRRLIRSISESDLLEWLPVLLGFPILDDENIRVRMDFSNPFMFTGHINENFLKRNESFCLSEDKFSELVGYVANEKNGKREWCVRILMELFRLGLLTKEQVISFSFALWSDVDEFGFPDRTEYYKFAFCEELAPDKIDGKALIRDYLLAAEIPTQKQQSDQGISLGGGNIPICFEIVGASHFVDWDVDETHLIFQKLLQWWDADNEFLEYKKDSDIRGEFLKRFKNLQLALITATSKQFDEQRQEDVNSLKRMVSEMNDYGLPVCRVQCAFLHLIPEWKENVFEIISTSFLHADKAFIGDAVEAIHDLLKNGSGYAGGEAIKSTLGLLSSTLRLRDEARLIYSLYAGSRILANYDQYFIDEFESSVLFTLEKLIAETTKEANVFDFSEALLFREVAARLAYSMFCFYESNGKEVPEVILKWKTICQSNEEFVEIRNGWV